MKRLKNIKNIELGLILALLALGVLLPWHSPLFGGNTASNRTSSGYEEVREGLLAKQTTIPQPKEQKPDFSPSISQGNTVLALSQIPEEKEQKEKTRKINVVITAYSSTVDQTDSTPFTTAAGTKVERGVVANNALPFGTEIKIPELYGEETFTVEDRLNWKKSNYHVDIWFPSREKAIEFGRKHTYIEVLES